MTQPKQASRSSNGPRVYKWPPQPPHELEVISVTSALAAGLPKPFLIGWAAKMSAEFAVDNLEAVKTLVDSGQKRAAVDLIKGARFRDMGNKADRGTIVHAAVEAYVAGKALDKKEVEERLEEARVDKVLWTGALSMVQGVYAFLQDTEPEIYWSEATVYSREHGYAGTADLIARLHVGSGRVPVVIDVKTSKRIYDEVGLQLAAYALADFVGLDDGTEAEIVPEAAAIEHGMVVRPTPSGSYETATFALTPELYERFLAILAVARTRGLEAQCRRPS